MKNKITVIVVYEKKRHNEYIKLFDACDYFKFKPMSSIVMIKNSKTYWHDYNLDIKYIKEFFNYFDNIAYEYRIIP